METSMEDLQKTKNRLPYYSAIPFQGIYPKKKTKTLIQKDPGTPMFIATLFMEAMIWKQPKCP